MNMQINQPVRLTAAETALVEAFAAQVGELPGNGAVTGTRDRLLDDLKRSGLPTRRIESWHYTDLKNLLRSVPERVAGGVSVDSSLVDSVELDEPPQATRVSAAISRASSAANFFISGRSFPAEDCSARL